MSDRNSISIADCALCAEAPHKIEEDLRDSESRMILPLYEALDPVVRLSDSETHAYASSQTHLLKCPHCGTYYYFNHYRDDGEHFMDPTYNEMVLLRYDPYTAMDFLERVSGDKDGALPNAAGQLANAFLEGGSAPRTRVAERDPHAERELAQLRDRYDTLIDAFERLIAKPTPAWQLKFYLVMSLCHHYAARADWESIRGTLLRHTDPVIRLLAARLILGIGTGDAPTVDILQTPLAVRAFLRGEMSSRSRIATITAILLRLAIRGRGETQQYRSGYGVSGYHPESVRVAALYGLVVAAGRGGDFTRAVPALLNLCLDDPASSYHICWAIEALVKRRQARARVVLGALAAFDADQRRRLMADAHARKLLEFCGDVPE